MSAAAADTMDVAMTDAPAAPESAPVAAAAAAEPAAATSSSAAAQPSASPAPAPEDDAQEDALINDANFDEEDLMDDAKPKGRGRGRPAPAASSGPPEDALERLNALLQRTEQFAKFVPTKAEAKAEAKKNRGRAGRNHERAAEEEEDKELVADELAGDKPSWPDHLDEQPSAVTKAGGLPMRDYQLEALNWLIKLHDQNLNGILADEMGLGKTLESLSLLAYLKQYRNYCGPHLIIVPKSTISNWYREVNRWTSNLKCFKFHGNQEERDAMKPLVTTHDVTLSTYEMVIREKSFFAKVPWKYIYIDEAHRIKNENSLLSKVVRSFSSEHRLLITGTPLQNNLHELWALLNFLSPTLFNSGDDFASWFDVEDASQRGEIVARLHRLLRPFLLRRLKSDVEKALLPKIETKLFVGMSAMQKAWYKKILERDIEVLNATSTSKVKLLNIVMQLRKVCNHPYLFTGAEPGPPYLEGEHIVDNSSKMVLLSKLLIKLKAGGNRVLIFSQMTRVLDILEDFSRYRGYDYCRIDGQTKQDERDQAMDVFNAPGSQKFIFLLSTRAGGLGINLQTADTVILFDSDWNPQMDLQAMDRAHRIGQKAQVVVYRFVVEHSIEQKMVERATKKLFLDALVVKQGRMTDAEKSVSSQELQDMVRFGANRIFSGADTEMTDADIDLILSRGSEMTRAETEKLKQNKGNDLLNFSLSSDKETNFQMFEGKDYRGVRAQSGFEFIEPSKRERKSNYDINAYYRDALRVNEKKPTKQNKEFRPTQRFDYQFFQVERLDVLEKKDHDSKQKLFHLKTAVRMREREERRQKEEREKEERRKARYQKLKLQRLADAQAAGQTLPATTVEEDETALGGLDSEDDKEEEPAAAAAAMPSPSPSPAAAAAADVPTKMELDDETPVKQEEGTAAAAAASSTDASVKTEDASVKAEDGSVKAEGDSVKMEDVSEASDAGRRKSSRSRQSGGDKRAAPTPSPLPVAEEEDAEGDDALDAELMLEAGCLTQEERVELTRLQEEGFGTWSRRHITSFTKAMEKYGRKDLSNIKVSVEEKTPEEVEKYFYVFWQKYKQIKDWDRIIKQIERGELRLTKQKALQAVIDQKVRRYRGNFEKMTIPYPTTSQKSFTEEEDKFLIVSLHRLGYGNWEDLKSAIRTSWMFRFDWYLKSRTCGELSKRVEYLLKLLEKEQGEWDEKKNAAEAKRKSKALKEAKQALASTAGAATPSPTKKKSSKDKEKESSSSTSSKKKSEKEDSSSSKKKSDSKASSSSSSSKKPATKESSSASSKKKPSAASPPSKKRKGDSDAASDSIKKKKAKASSDK